ncbi:WbqC family protein [Polynucleobacter sp. AP-Nino-20-G2]|uniref:WbqC family protein n=1 Tax=Polynucleobacter sp. AP-Nino-20-G2 TaxID=2576917 RepID=UPI001BFDD147|nr:WbqC family protein [Polynucleobacter sp. AP-Nino-20-G2]QWE16950.1 WbqC family protein [Polynucleobacter sp. AP-Nino-20-G2]
MILTAHQPCYIPWLGFFQKLASADLFIYLDEVQYQVNDWNNRNRIKTHQGAMWLTVPILRKNHLNKKIKDVEINASEPWGKKHWKSIQNAYSKAPFFYRYSEFFADTYDKKWYSLVDLNRYMLGWFLETLKIQVEVRPASNYQFVGRKGDLVLDICKQLHAEKFIFGALGRDYADLEVFKREGIETVFQDYAHPIYSQLHGEFTPNLSVIDLIFNCGDESKDILLSGNTTPWELVK